MAIHSGDCGMAAAVWTQSYIPCSAARLIATRTPQSAHIWLAGWLASRQADLRIMNAGSYSRTKRNDILIAIVLDMNFNTANECNRYPDSRTRPCRELISDAICAVATQRQMPIEFETLFSQKAGLRSHSGVSVG